MDHWDIIMQTIEAIMNMEMRSHEKADNEGWRERSLQRWLGMDDIKLQLTILRSRIAEN